MLECFTIQCFPLSETEVMPEYFSGLRLIRNKGWKDNLTLDRVGGRFMYSSEGSWGSRMKGLKQNKGEHQSRKSEDKE